MSIDLGYFAPLDPKTEDRLAQEAATRRQQREDERRTTADAVMREYLTDPHTPDAITLRRLYSALESRGITREDAVGAFWKLLHDRILAFDQRMITIDRARLPTRAHGAPLDVATGKETNAAVATCCYWCGDDLGDRLFLCLPAHRPGTVLTFCRDCGEDQRTDSLHRWIAT